MKDYTGMNDPDPVKRAAAFNLNMSEPQVARVPWSKDDAPLRPTYERVNAALKYAIKVIENYAMDIRSKPALVAEGFCQGSIYLEAKADIAKILSGETKL